MTEINSLNASKWVQVNVHSSDKYKKWILTYQGLKIILIYYTRILSWSIMKNNGAYSLQIDRIFWGKSATVNAIPERDAWFIAVK